MNSLKVVSFLNVLRLICLHTSIAIASTQLNGFSYCYLTLIIIFKINHMFAYSEEVISIAIGHWHNGLSVSQWCGRMGFNSRSSHPKELKKNGI